MLGLQYQGIGQPNGASKARQKSTGSDTGQGVTSYWNMSLGQKNRRAHFRDKRQNADVFLKHSEIEDVRTQKRTETTQIKQFNP